MSRSKKITISEEENELLQKVSKKLGLRDNVLIKSIVLERINELKEKFKL